MSKQSYLKISDNKLKEIIKNAKNWNDVLRDCNLNTLTRKLQKQIQKNENDYSHLPKNYGGLFSKLNLINKSSKFFL